MKNSQSFIYVSTITIFSDLFQSLEDFAKRYSTNIDTSTNIDISF